MLQARQRVNQRGRGPRPRLGQAERHAVDRVGRPLSERPSRHRPGPARAPSGTPAFRVGLGTF